MNNSSRPGPSTRPKMADDLSTLEDWATPLLAALTGPERRRLAREVGQALRRSQSTRIAAQLNPDGSRFDPRKAQPSQARQQKGKIRRSMFTKLRTARLLKILLDADGVSIGFTGRTSRIARVHQDGQADEVRPGGPKVRYPQRVLLGFTDADHELIRDLILQHVSG